ncbi:MAG: LPXTG cell wall anchor domain-containing protein [Clostridia bacterium]
MKNKRIVITLLLAIVIFAGMVTQSFAAIGDGVSATVTSNPANGAEVKEGDEITYTITLKNNSDKVYYIPTLMTQIPSSTEFVSISTDNMPAAPEVDEATGTITCLGEKLDAHAQQVYTLKVKVTQASTGEINYAHRTEHDENASGAVMFMLFNSLDEAELNEVFAIIESDEFNNAATRDEAQALLGEKAYLGIVTQKQFHTIARTEQPTNPVPSTKPTTQEPAIQEPVIQEPVIKEEKPTVLPKTGMEINYIAISIASLMIVAGIVLVLKKRKFNRIK